MGRISGWVKFCKVGVSAAETGIFATSERILVAATVDDAAFWIASLERAFPTVGKAFWAEPAGTKKDNKMKNKKSFFIKN